MGTADLAMEHPLIMTAQGLRDWVVVASIGGDITARSAAARLSVIDKAVRAGVDPPDVREWDADQVEAR